MCQDLPFCTPASSPCIDSVPVTSDDCRVSCTGLYADVTVEDNSVVEVLEGGKTIKLNFVSALVQYKGEFRVKLEHLLQAKDTEDVPKFMEKYKSYKSRYMENVKFDPSTPGLSMFMGKSISTFHIPQIPQ